MSLESNVRRFQLLSRSLGKRALNALFPDDFELYIFAFELTNGDDVTEDYFIFPINPNSISEPNIPIQSIRKTAGGVTTLNTTTFAPTTINIQGSFGRKFKFLAGSLLVNFSAIGFKPKLTSTFSKSFKTGYGCYREMERILDKSNKLDSKGQPYSLYFYNLALGHNYLVKFTELTPSMNQDSNMIWNYSLTLKSLCRIEDIVKKDKRSLTGAMSAKSFLQGSVNSIGNSIGSLIP
jgi:hypothetical protein